jgi:thiol-disulfide isomerase/thioredoxin
MAGVVLQPAPAEDWKVSAWLNGDPGSLYDHRGQVVLIGFVQLWCPGSQEFSIPLLQRWSELYGDREEVVLVLVHSVFEGHDQQSPERLREFIHENGISLPVGIDAYDDAYENVPVTMRRYDAGGTPHLAIVDKEGLLRFTHFGTFEHEPTKGFIERLLEEPPGGGGRGPETVAHAEQTRPTPGSSLSGTYVFRSERATGVCATLIPRMEVPAELQFYSDAIDLDFAQPFLGLGALEVQYDSQTGRIKGEKAPRNVAAGAMFSNAVLHLEGMLDREADPPALEFELSFLNGKCTVPGQAQREP